MTDPLPVPAAPALPDRHVTIDAVRGVAVMGILLMNVVAMGMPEAAYMNPRAYGGAEGLDLGVYLVNFVLFDGKMRGLFSFLFGASMLLVIERAEAKGESRARVHYARMVVLLAFGLAHLWLIWWGDIINHYALIGMIAFFFRRARVRTLIVVGLVFVLVELLIVGMFTAGVGFVEAGASRPGAAPQLIAQYREMQNSVGIPSPEFIRRDPDIHRGGWWAMVGALFPKLVWFPLATVFQVGAETLAYMLFGMAAYRTGLFTGAWERARYLRWMAIGFGIGIPSYCLMAWALVAADFSMTAVVGLVIGASTIVRPLMILGWACLLVLLLRRGGALTDRLAAAGRMAFTNYLMTSILVTGFFYGWGLGFYGELGRAELYIVVLGMWALILLWSKPWLSHFRYGPFEWLWRTLARGRPQAMAGGAINRPVASGTQ